MNLSLLFLPDISGFTKFIQTTEAEHSQHVIAELLEVLINANTEGLHLAEIEGDALFFYKEKEIPSLEKLLAQVEQMFTAFYSHLKLLENNRVCPCNACSTAHNLQLKIIAHCGDIQFINVQNSRKPFGKEVIEVHRLMKNSVNSDNYVLFSSELSDIIHLSNTYKTKLYHFKSGSNTYDGKELSYLYSIIDKKELKLKPYQQAKKIEFKKTSAFIIEKEFPVAANELLEFITNFKYRKYWIADVDDFEFNINEVNRIGTEHICVIKDKHLNFITVTKKGKPGQLVYGEMTTSPPPVDALYQFHIISPLTSSSCKLETEVYFEAKSPIKKLLTFLFLKKVLKKNTTHAIINLFNFVTTKYH
ncbi:DUF2652 domain-containing protein [Tenacibaculum sp. S7007]|uniref:DUF2652 domain-containing protein n=2 Tax=Tenacibaculum pelagium TaxID=2759527 RepID=A0A839AQI6_9FLAO|nr:DUF2652 domain-containing protein [Tenacibaculum pelagium]